jgi:hypothetical protein
MENEKNEALIASAPKLLKKLKECYEVIGAIDESAEKIIKANLSSEFDVLKLYEEIRKVINQATKIY